MSRKLAAGLSAVAITLLMLTLLYITIPRQEIGLTVLQLGLGVIFVSLLSTLGLLLPAKWFDNLKKKSQRSSHPAKG